jgi:hypothetical protein
LPTFRPPFLCPTHSLSLSNSLKCQIDLKLSSRHQMSIGSHDSYQLRLSSVSLTELTKSIWPPNSILNRVSKVCFCFGTFASYLRLWFVTLLHFHLDLNCSNHGRFFVFFECFASFRRHLIVDPHSLSIDCDSLSSLNFPFPKVNCSTN